MKRIFFLLLLILQGTVVLAQTDQEVALAEEYLNKGEYEKAVTFYEKFHRFEPKNKIYYKNYVICLVELKETKEAEKVIRHQVKEFPMEQSYKVDLGEFYKKSGDEKRGKQVFDDALKDLPPYLDKVTELANAFLLANEVDYAIATYDKGRKLLGNQWAFNYALAELYSIKGDNQKMMDELLDVLRNDPFQVGAVEAALMTILDDDPNSTLNQLLKNTLLREVQKNPENTVYTDLLIWLFIQHRNFEGAFTQAKAIDKRLNEYGERLLELARICLENRKYDLAVKCYEYVISKGRDNMNYIHARVELLKVMNLRLTEDYALNRDELINLEKNYITTIEELGSTPQTVPLSIELAHLQAFYLGKSDDAMKVVKDILDMRRGKAEDLARAKLEMADILVLRGDLWEPSLLYGQVEKEYKNDLLGQDAKFRNAKLSFYRGEFEWAQAQMSVLKASTSKLIANDALALSLLIMDNTGLDMDTTFRALNLYAHADLLNYQGQLDKAMLYLDTIATDFPFHSIQDEVLNKRAEISLKRGDLEKAAGYYEAIVKDFGTDILADDALFKLGDLYERKFNNMEKALEYYKEIMLHHKSSMYVIEARKRYMQLKGEKVN